MRILVVEDSERLATSLQNGLRKAGHAVDRAADGRQALAYARANPYGLILLDLMLPILDGWTVLRTLRDEGCKTKVLVLSARGEIPDRVLGLRMGADDYLSKPFSFDELLARVDALGRRAEGLTRDQVEIGPLVVDSVSKTARCEGARLELTAREYSVLACLARRQGRIVSREELEDHLYDEHNFPMSNAVPAAISRLRTKLHDAGARDLLRTHRGMGYVLEAPAV